MIPVPRWSFNGDLDRPHFNPSVKISSGHYVQGHDPAKDCWCTYLKAHPEEEVGFSCGICHYFLHDGELRYCGDSTHHLAGKNIPLPDLPAEYRDIQ